MTADRTDYRADAEADAKTMFQEFVDEMCEQWESDREVSTDFNNDYSGGDEYHHSTHVDKEYDLTEAAAVLDELSDYEETDEGLWDGLAPRKAISVQAAFTYGNAVASMWYDIVKEVNESLTDLRERIETEVNPAFTDEDLSDDATEGAVTLAGQRYLRLYSALIDLERDAYEGMAGAAIDGAGQGDWTAALALADAVQEVHGERGLAEAIRNAVA